MKILDLFCGAGGAGMGYHRAGFEVVGVDLDPQPHYPFEFIQRDALNILAQVIQSGGAGYDAIHASPPCQWSSNLTRGTNKHRRSLHTNLIPAVRELLKLTGLPYVIENVQGSEVRRDLTLCGGMFGLDVIRHRYFEISGFDAVAPTHIPHRGKVAGWRHGQYFNGPYVAVYGNGGGKGSVAQWQRAMGIDWTDDRHGLAEAIPPAYTEHIGRQLITQIQERAA